VGGTVVVVATGGTVVVSATSGIVVVTGATVDVGGNEVVVATPEPGGAVSVEASPQAANTRVVPRAMIMSLVFMVFSPGASI
jgi:hypothetical protein